MPEENPVEEQKPKTKSKSSAEVVSDEADREKRIRDLETNKLKHESDLKSINEVLAKLNAPSPYVPPAPFKKKSSNPIVEFFQDIGILE